MNREWYILLEGSKEGPYSVSELRKHPAVTPDTLVWKVGFSSWIPVRDVPELGEIFKDEPESRPLGELFKKSKSTLSDLGGEGDTLTLQHDPMQFFLWLLIIFLLTLYILFRFYRPFLKI
jgi:hypothetical protein